jgi:leader peptidase (prepilin peptidase)/N-methyltransferase
VARAVLSLGSVPQIYFYLFAAFAFILGAAIGSFLNVCIYRMPRDLSVNEPKRSFCPSCKYQIPWYRNLPLFSWLALRGKCANCGAGISFRYFGVELLTGLLFLAVWLKVSPDQWLLAFPYWVLVSLFVVATFIDFEFFIIPDEITWGGAVAGALLSFAMPPLMGVDSNLLALMWSLIGGATGYLLLWGVVELGKKAFGKKRISFDKQEAFTWTRNGEDAELIVGGETQLWSEFFARETDRMLMTCSEIEVAGERFTDTTAEFHYNRVSIAGKQWELIKLDTLSGKLTEIVIPREAMGFGDVKFMACIGAFLGWKAVLFTVMSASMVGAVVGILTIVLGKREWSTKIPFGPYLALGALIWLFSGPELVDWYWNLANPPEL